MENGWKKCSGTICGQTGLTNCVIKMGGKIVWKNCAKKLCEILGGKLSEIIGLSKLYSIQLTVYSVQLTVYSLKYTVYNVQYKLYSKAVLFSLWREPQCSSVWEVKPFAKLLLCLTPPEDSRAVFGDLKME